MISRLDCKMSGDRAFNKSHLLKLIKSIHHSSVIRETKPISRVTNGQIQASIIVAIVEHNQLWQQRTRSY
jgi:hypothetical protein